MLRCTLAANEDAYDWAAYDIAMAHWLLGLVLQESGQVGAALTWLAEAQSRFETLAAAGEATAAIMAAVAITEQAECLRAEGRLDAASAAYEEANRRAKERNDDREVARNTIGLGTVRLYQEFYDDALAAYQDAHTLFERLGDLDGVAVTWHQIGMVHRHTGDAEAAERAYRQSLAIKVQQGNRADQAVSLLELGNLYDQMRRLEEAVTFYQQAADLYVALGNQMGEGQTRNNIARTLVKLGRYNAARVEIRRAIQCKQSIGHAARPWTAWNILHDIERACGDGVAGQLAWQQARTSYLAYRHDGGYTQADGGQLGDAIWQIWQSGDATVLEQVTTALAKIIASPDEPEWWRTLAAKFQAILAGARDPTLADDPALDYSNAAEVLWLIERLGGNTTAD